MFDSISLALIELAAKVAAETTTSRPVWMAHVPDRKSVRMNTPKGSEAIIESGVRLETQLTRCSRASLVGPEESA